MKNVGSLLKEARLRQKKSIEQIARQTRIKEKFLSALESADWGALPDFSIAQGFARSYAQNVNLDPRLVTALVRRDFPEPRIALRENEISLMKESIWTPKTTILTVSGILVLGLGFYLFSQYRYFVAAPPTSLSKVQMIEDKIFVAGKTLSTATVEVNNHPVLVASDGNFEVQIEKQELLNSQVVVKSTSRTGKTTTISKSVTQ